MQKGSNDGPGKETTRPKNKKGARRGSHELKIVPHKILETCQS